MYPLNDEQVDLIGRRLSAGGVKTGKLHEDLLDHVCCFVESRMERDEDFDLAYREALEAIAPSGYHEIEEELFFLIHFHKQLTMKRILFFSGFATCFLITSGMLFKLLHWPGANVMMVTGFAALIFTSFVICANALKHFASQSASYKWRIMAGVLAAVMISTGTIFKIFHFPFANVLSLLGIVTLNLVFLPMFFYQLYRQALSRV
jgi:hypothetical protein